MLELALPPAALLLQPPEPKPPENEYVPATSRWQKNGDFREEDGVVEEEQPTADTDLDELGILRKNQNDQATRGGGNFFHTKTLLMIPIVRFQSRLIGDRRERRQD
jgi:hypothetical protein